MPNTSTEPTSPAPATRFMDRKFAIALLLCSFIWVLPWSRTFQLSVLVLAITSIVLLIRSRRDWWAPGAGSWCLMNLLATTALALSAAASEYPSKPLELVGFQLVILLAGMPVLLWARDEVVWQKLQWCLFAIIGFWLVDGLFQALVGFDVFGVPRMERLGGYFSHPHKFGYYIPMLCAWVLFAPQVRQWNLGWQGAAFLLCLAVTFFGNTRAGWLSFLLISTTWVYLSRHKLRGSPWLLGLIPAAVAIAGWWISGDSEVNKRVTATIPNTIDFAGLASVIPIRIQLWAQAWAQFLESPWFGTGAGNFSLYLPESWAGTNLQQPYPHQVLLEVLAGSGAVGSLLYLAATVYFCRLLWRAGFSGVAEHSRPIAPLLMLIGAWFPLNTHRELFSSEMMVFTWLSIALVIARVPGKALINGSGEKPEKDTGTAEARHAGQANG